MSDRTNLHRKQANTSIGSNPALAAATPTLATPSQSLSPQVNTVAPTTAVLLTQQDPQLTSDRQLPEGEAVDRELMRSIDLSRISLRSPSKLATGQAGSPAQPDANRAADDIMRMPAPENVTPQLPEIRSKSHDLSRMTISAKHRFEPSPAAILPSIQRQCAACEEDRSSQPQLTPMLLPTIQREPDKMPPKQGTTSLSYDLSRIPIFRKQEQTNTLESSVPESIGQRIQASSVNDRLEVEANSVADRVMSMPAPSDTGTEQPTSPLRFQNFQGSFSIQRDPTDTPQDAKQRALAIKDALIDGWTEDEEKALNQIRGQSVLILKEIRAQYKQVTGGRVLESDFKEYCSSSEYKEALSLLNATLSLEDRLRTNIDKGWLFNSENEKGMLEVLRHASRPELDEAAKSPQVMQLLKNSLNDDEYYKARKLLTPNDMYEIVIDRIKNAKGTFNDDESGAYNALFDLTNEQRKQLWKDRQDLFSFMSASERESARKMCEGTDAEALKERMNEATSGWGTDDDAVKLVVDKTQTAAQQEQAIKQAISTGKTPDGQPLTPEKIAQLQTQLQQLGGIKDNLLTPELDRDGNLKSGSFLEMLNDDVSSQEFQAFAETMGVDQLQRAKQQILDAIGTFNDDEEAIYKAFDRLVGNIELPPDSLAKLTPEQRAAAQRIANQKIRQQLLNDPDVKKALTAHLSKEEMDEVNTYVSGDTYKIALKKLEAAYSGVDTDEEGIFKIICAMSAADRQKMKDELPRIYLELVNPNGLFTAEEQAMIRDAVDTGKIPTDKALNWAFGGWGDGTEEEMLEQTFTAMDDAERHEYRLGYFLHKGGQLPAATEQEKTAQQQAKDKFQKLYQRMDDELGSDDLQKALDRLLGTPTLDELKTEQGRLMAVGIMNDRIGEKGDIRENDSASSAIVDIFSDQGEVTDQSEARFQSLYKEAIKDGKLTDEEFAALAALDADFAQQHDEYVATIDQVTGIASTVAAIAVGIAVTVLSGGSAGPAVAAFLTQYGVVGTAVIAGTASAAAKVGTSELVGGSHYDAASTEGLKDAASGFADGAMAVLSVGLATRFTNLIGLSKAGLAAEMTAGILASSDAAISQAGKTFVNAGIRSGIEGFLSGAVGEIVLTTADEKTWKQSVWGVIKTYGAAILKGGGIGAVTGAITGGTLEALGTYVGVKRIQGLLTQLESVGINQQRLSTMNLGTIRALGQADAALAAGKIEEAEAAFKLLQGELSPDELNNARKELYKHHTGAEPKAPLHNAGTPIIDPNGRVRSPVSGLYDAIDPSKAPPGWTFQDDIQHEAEGIVSITTTVTAPNGQTGVFERAFDPVTGKVEMRNAFLEKLPKWVESDLSLVAGKGTPTVAFMTMYQMKKLGVGFGQVKTFKMSTIQNVEAIFQLEVARRQGEALDKAIIKTHSVIYAETPIIQSGHQIVGAEVKGGTKTEIQQMLSHYEQGGEEVIKRHNELLQKYGLKRTDEMLWNYNIYLKVQPLPSGVSAPPLAISP
jgi:hypothetical protein